MRIERERNACSFLCTQRSFSCSLVICIRAHPDTRENVDRSHQGTCVLSVACIEPQHSGSVRLATSSVSGSRDWELPYSSSFLTLSLAPQQMLNKKVGPNDGWLTSPRIVVNLALPFMHKIQIVGSLLTPEKVSHLTSSGHRSPATAVHYAKRA